jgi:methyl-accepting chemotaxis protein
MFVVLVIAVVAVVVAGGCGYRLGCRRADPGALGAGGAGGGAAGAGTEAYLDSIARLGHSVTPVWSTQVESSRRQMEAAVTGLVGTFGGIVQGLDDALGDALESSRFAVSQDRGDVFETSRERLGGIVSTLDMTLEMKRRTLAELRVLRDLNEDMKKMIGEVTRIAANTHLLALNAAIEAERVGEAGRAFRVVATEVRRLADESAGTSERIGQKADAVSQAIEATFALAEVEAEQEEEVVARANSSVASVLSDLMAVVEGLRTSSAHLGDAAHGIKDQIAQSLVEFQFQDRISQTLEHLRDSIDRLPPMIEQSLSGGVHDLAPVDVDVLLDSLKDSYTMAEEHYVHESGETVAVRETEITFF